MAKIIEPLCLPDSEIVVRTSDLFAVMKEAAKAELLLNAATCEIPHKYARQIVTGIKEYAETPAFAGNGLRQGNDSAKKQEPTEGQQDAQTGKENGSGAAGKTTAGSVGIAMKVEERVEWIDIQDIIRKGHAGVLLPPGTEIHFTLKNGDPASVVVVGVDHYRKNDAVFWFRRIVGRHCMNRNGKNAGGFPYADDMNEYLNEIYSLLPDELQMKINLHESAQKIRGETIKYESCLFLMTEFEGSGSAVFSEYNDVGKQFPFFRERRNRIAYNADGDPVWYWTADPSAADTMNYCAFASYGDSNRRGASYEGGVAPLFVIE